MGVICSRICGRKFDSTLSNVLPPTHIELFAVASFSVFGSVESVDGNPHVGSSDLCISTQDQLIQSIMDEVVLCLHESKWNN